MTQQTKKTLISDPARATIAAAKFEFDHVSHNGKPLWFTLRANEWHLVSSAEPVVRYGLGADTFHWLHEQITAQAPNIALRTTDHATLEPDTGPKVPRASETRVTERGPEPARSNSATEVDGPVSPVTVG